MQKPVSTEPFYVLVTSLAQSGFASHATRLENTLNSSYTTSTELIGELGAVVCTIRKECTPLSPAQKKLISACLNEVRKAWPGFGWLPFYW